MIQRGGKCRLWHTFGLLLTVAGLAEIAYGYAEATSDPVVRNATFVVPGLLSTEGLTRVLLLSDMHVQAPDMTHSRLERIVQQANALSPDIIVLAGDFIGDDYSATKTYSESQATAPLAGLRAKIGIFAILGNNDRLHADEAIYALEKRGITVIEDRAVQLGPIAIAGLRTRYGSSIHRLLKLHGFRILVSHSPDGFANLPKGVGLMLAGHTHCGQVVFPFIGALATGSRFGSHYLCGVTVRDGSALVVTAGLGTSNFPIRIGAPPDMWLIQLESPTLQSASR